jgi:hypothetical protein
MSQSARSLIWSELHLVAKALERRGNHSDSKCVRKAMQCALTAWKAEDRLWRSLRPSDEWAESLTETAYQYYQREVEQWHPTQRVEYALPQGTRYKYTRKLNAEMEEKIRKKNDQKKRRCKDRIRERDA